MPPEALEPLMRRVIDNGFQLTGLIERGDWDTVERHRAAIAETAPELLPAYDALAALTARAACRRERRRDRRADHRRCPCGARGPARRPDRPRADDGRAPRRPSRAARRRWSSCDTVVMSLFVNPAQFGDAADLNGYPRDEAHDLDAAREAGVDVVFAPSAGELYLPATRPGSR